MKRQTSLGASLCSSVNPEPQAGFGAVWRSLGRVGNARSFAVCFDCSQLVLHSLVWGWLTVAAVAQNLGSEWFGAPEFTKDGNLGAEVSLFGGAVVIRANTMINPAAPFVLNASKSVGTVYVDADPSPYLKGLGVQTADASGSAGISGGGAHEDEELVFVYNGQGAYLDTIQMILNDYAPGDGVGDADDPAIWFVTAVGQTHFANEALITAASTVNSGLSYTVDFAAFAALTGDPRVEVTQVYVRETADHLFVKGFTGGTLVPPGSPVPESSLALLWAAGWFGFSFRRGRSRSR